MKKIFLVLLFIFSLFAGESEEIVPIIKHKTVIKDGIGVSNFVINSKQMGLIKDGPTANFRKYSSDYVSHISATIDNMPIFDAELRPYMSDEPRLLFTFKSFTNSDDITFNVTDHHGKIREQSFKIIKKGTQETNSILYEQYTVSSVVINPKAWEAVTIDDAIREVYGATKIDEIPSTEISNIGKKVGQPCVYWDKSKECLIDKSSPVIVRIESKMDLKSIAIFSNTTAKSLIAFIQVPGHKMTDIVLPIKFEKDGTLFFVVEGKDKKLYRSSQQLIKTGLQLEGDADNSISSMHYILEDNSPHSKAP